jgi:predicted N-formylglutamate amidohydrolase
MNETLDSLLAADEPPAFTADNETGTSPLLIVADHAGKHFPRRLGQLGLSDAEAGRHIAWDIGIGAVCRLIGQALGAVVIRQNYSRLVIDCNRAFRRSSSPITAASPTSSIGDGKPASRQR